MVMDTGLPYSQTVSEISIAEALVAVLLDKGISQFNQTVMGGHNVLLAPAGACYSDTTAPGNQKGSGRSCEGNGYSTIQDSGTGKFIHTGGTGDAVVCGPGISGFHIQ